MPTWLLRLLDFLISVWLAAGRVEGHLVLVTILVGAVERVE
jgi:hypothetical protein